MNFCNNLLACKIDDNKYSLSWDIDISTLKEYLQINYNISKIFKLIDLLDYDIEIDSTNKFNSINKKYYLFSNIQNSKGKITQSCIIDNFISQQDDTKFYFRVRIKNQPYSCKCIVSDAVQQLDIIINDTYNDYKQINVNKNFIYNIIKSMYDMIPDQYSYSKGNYNANFYYILQVFATQINKLIHKLELIKNSYFINNCNPNELTEIFGQILQLNSISNISLEEYRRILIELLKSIKFATTENSVTNVIKYVVGDDCELKNMKDIYPWILRGKNYIKDDPTDPSYLNDKSNYYLFDSENQKIANHNNIISLIEDNYKQFTFIITSGNFYNNEINTELIQTITNKLKPVYTKYLINIEKMSDVFYDLDILLKDTSGSLITTETTINLYDNNYKIKRTVTSTPVSGHIIISGIVSGNYIIECINSQYIDNVNRINIIENTNLNVELIDKYHVLTINLVDSFTRIHVSSLVEIKVYKSNGELQDYIVETPTSRIFKINNLINDTYTIIVESSNYITTTKTVNIYNANDSITVEYVPKISTYSIRPSPSDATVKFYNVDGTEITTGVSGNVLSIDTGTKVYATISKAMYGIKVLDVIEVTGYIIVSDGLSEAKYMFFSANQANSTVGIEVHGTPAYSLMYSLDAINWNYLSPENDITLSHISEKVYIKGTYSNQDTVSNYITFKLNGSLSVGGCCYSILTNTDGTEVTDLRDYGNSLFYRLFYNQTALETVFNNFLPADTLSEACYASMFMNCSSLTTVCDLPATNLANHCYGEMFMYCTSLTTSSILYATILKSQCYNNLFFGCTSLNSIKVYYTGNFDSTYTNLWVTNIATAGDFYYNGSDVTRGISAIPNNWTIHTF